MVVIENNGWWILKKIDSCKNLEDLEFAIKTEEAWRRIEKDEGIKMNFYDFPEELRNW